MGNNWKTRFNREKMNWEQHKLKLALGETVSFRPHGNSMQPIIESGNLVTVEPISKHSIKEGDVVFCKVKGTFYVHLVEAVMRKKGDTLVQIGNNKKHTNGTISIDDVFGKVVKVES
jgi:phage repressor protein C with HTH and peptisase S24 domain